jgi:SAM-dependent methyltransferase
MASHNHDQDLAHAFDRQAERFEQAKVSRDAASLARFVAFAGLPEGSRVLDAGCGPGLVAEAFLEAGCDVVGVDLSAEMVRRAQERCARFGARARFEQRSLFALGKEPAFDAALSRNVLHHVEDPRAFVAAQARHVRPGGLVLALDLTGDPDPARGAWLQEVERGRDRTHTRTLTTGELLDLLGAAGLEDLRVAEEEIRLDFDEWFDRGSPSAPKEAVRARILEGSARGFAPRHLPQGGVEIRCLRAAVRGTRPG